MSSFEKIAGPMRLDSGVNGADKDYPLPPRAGGRNVKSLMYMVKVIAGASNAKVGFRVAHSADGSVTATHTTVASATISTPPAMMTFDAGSAVLGEFIHPIPVVGGTATTDYVVVEIYEMRKPF